MITHARLSARIEMQTQRVLAIALVVAGVGLIIMGSRAANSFNSQISRLFTGSATDRAIWLTICGVIAIFAGASVAYRTSRD